MTFKPPSFMVSDENIDKDLDQPTDSVEQVESINNDTNTKTLDLNKSNFKKQHMIINKIFKNQKQL